MNLKTMTVEKLENGICNITINNPPANTLNGNIQNDLATIIDTLGNDPEARVLVFKSAHPKIFIAGADLNQMGSNDGPIDYAEGAKAMQEIFNRLEKLSKPTIAVINGHALGGGCEFVLACDFRIMSAGTIGLTEVSLGLLPAAGGTQRLTRLLGQAKATEMMLLSKRLRPQEAEQIGLITKAVTPENLEEEVSKLATQLAEGAIQSMGLVKKCIQSANLDLDEGLKIEREAFAKTFTTGEPEEGMRAFFEKRKPNFSKLVIR